MTYRAFWEWKPTQQAQSLKTDSKERLVEFIRWARRDSCVVGFVVFDSDPINLDEFMKWTT